MKNKIILLCITIALATNVFSKNVENHQKEIKQEISNQNEKDSWKNDEGHHGQKPDDAPGIGRF